MIIFRCVHHNSSLLSLDVFSFSVIGLTLRDLLITNVVFVVCKWIESNNLSQSMLSLMKILLQIYLLEVEFN